MASRGAEGTALTPARVRRNASLLALTKMPLRKPRRSVTLHLRVGGGRDRRGVKGLREPA
jgi:hypothetical protein